MRTVRQCLPLLTHIIVCLAALLVVFLLIEIVGMGPDYSIKLPRDYELVRVHSNTVVLTKSKFYVMEPTVDGYQVQGTLVIGHISIHPDSHSIPGYFVLDSKTGKLWKGLKETQMMGVLRRYGIIDQPSLRRPARLDALRQRIGRLFGLSRTCSRNGSL